MAKKLTSEISLEEKKEDHKKEEKVTSEEVKKLTPMDVFTSIISAYNESGDKDKINEFNNVFQNYLSQKFDDSGLSKDYELVILYDDTTMLKSDADKIYNAVTKFSKKKAVLMILLSNGGVASSAYLIGKLCREYSNNKFVIAVPRQAKSAATLLCCAADEIHMGSLSELGPIDPQINGLPALGLKNSIEHISEVVL